MKREIAEATKLANGKFQNHLHWNYSQPPFNAFLKWQFNRSSNILPKNPAELEKTLPICKPNFKASNLPKATLTWFGHASVMLQVGNFTVLTDPVFSTRAGPYSIFGPSRYRPCPIVVDDLVSLDAVVISHNHYDHLDQQTISALALKFPKAKWFVPLNNSYLLRNVAKSNITELNWWQSATHENFEFISVPAMHWSRRGVFDTNNSLWCGWIVKGLGGSFYFVGDTGYCSVFQAIGERYGPISASAIPVGAYEPRELMKNQHINREEAVKIHREVKSQHSLGIHWGTFVLTDEHYLEPRVLELDSTDKPFDTIDHGKSLVINWS